MKQYVVDQLRPSDYGQIRDYLEAHAETSVMDEIFRVELPEALLSEVQREHAACRPFYFAVSLELNQVAFELLVRSRQTLRCSCVGYASAPQRNFILDFADGMLDELAIKL